MNKTICVLVSGLVTAGLFGGCAGSRSASRAEAARAERQPPLSVDISVERTEVERRAAAEQRTSGEVAGAMLRPDECPMVENSSVAIIDLGDGAALEFVANDSDDVQRVRDRVLNVAVKHQRAMQARLDETQAHGGVATRTSPALDVRGAAEEGIEPMPASHVAVVDVDRGARIIFVPVDRSDLDSLNESLEQRAAFMAEGSCPANLMSMRVPEPDDAG